MAVGMLAIGLVALRAVPLHAQSNPAEPPARADAGAADAGAPDAGAPDAGAVDVGAADAGAADVGAPVADAVAAPERDDVQRVDGEAGEGRTDPVQYFVEAPDASQGATHWQEASDPRVETAEQPSPHSAAEAAAEEEAAARAAARAAAEEAAAIEAAAPYPVRFGLRPLTMPRRMLRLDGSYTLFRFPGEPSEFASIVRLGVAYGATDWLELSITDQQLGRRRLYTAGLIPLTFTSNSSGVSFGDLYASARFRFVRGPRFTMGIDVGFIIPTDTHFAIMTALPFRARTRDGVFSLDGSLEIALFFVDEGVVFSTPLTLSPRISPIEALTLGIDTGFALGDTFGNNRVTIPLGFEATYTIGLTLHRIDAFVNFTMPDFLQGEYSSAIGSRERTIQSDQWALTVGVRSYLDLR